MITLHQLQVFATVAEETSVSRAADRLCVSQPAVSATLAALRKEIGVDLVERNGRGIALTDAGRTMHKYAQTMLGLLDEAVEQARSATTDEERPVRIATSSSLASSVVAPILGKLREWRARDQADLPFTLAIGNRNAVWRMLAGREADLALTTKPPSNQDFETLATLPNSFVVVSRPGAVFAGRLEQVTWLVREDGAALRSVADEVIASLAIEPVRIEIGSDDALLGSVEAGLGIGVLPYAAVESAIREHSLVTVPTPMTPLSRPWHLIIRRDDVNDQRITGFASDMVAAERRFDWVAQFGGAGLNGSR
ncbi:MAG: LysR family transcriptional regulator [Actinomycetota bacterium]